MDERFLSDLVASGLEQARQQAEENHKKNQQRRARQQAEEKHKKNQREEQGMRKRTNITCSERYYQMRNRLNPKAHNYQTEKHRTKIEHFTGTIIDAEREVQKFINYHQRTNPYFKVISINTVSVPIGVTIYVTYED